MRQSKTMRNLDVISNKSIRFTTLKMNCSQTATACVGTVFDCCCLDLLVDQHKGILSSLHKNNQRDQNQHPDVHCRKEEGSRAPTE